jgi:hypothetical protein
MHNQAKYGLCNQWKKPRTDTEGDLWCTEKLQFHMQAAVFGEGEGVGGGQALRHVLDPWPRGAGLLAALHQS